MFAATTVQLQFGLKQPGRALACNSTKEGASASLDTMIFLIFHHSMTSDEAYFSVGMARGVDGPVAIKVSESVLTVDIDVDKQFINNGFKSIADILNQVPVFSGGSRRRNALCALTCLRSIVGRGGHT